MVSTEQRGGKHGTAGPSSSNGRRGSGSEASDDDDDEDEDDDDDEDEEGARREGGGREGAIGLEGGEGRSGRLRSRGARVNYREPSMLHTRRDPSPERGRPRVGAWINVEVADQSGETTWKPAEVRHPNPNPSPDPDPSPNLNPTH